MRWPTPVGSSRSARPAGSQPPASASPGNQSSSPTRATSCAGRCARRGWGCTGSTTPPRSISSCGGRRWRSTILSPPAAGTARAAAPSSWTSGRCSTTARRRGRRWRRRSDASLSVEPLRGRALVRADPLRLAQACGNLVANALEHGGSPVRVRGRVVAGRVRIEITDAGAGLPEPVSRLIARRRRGAPRGRGLTIAARIARDHGGRLSSAPSSRGACLVIELPSADAAPAIEPFPPSRFDPTWRPDTRPIPLDPSWRPRRPPDLDPDPPPPRPGR